MIGLAHLEQGIGLAAHFRPPDLQVVGKGPGADLAEAVGFGEMFDGDDGRHEGIYN